jgi:hypothetical protein
MITEAGQGKADVRGKRPRSSIGANALRKPAIIRTLPAVALERSFHEACRDMR